MTALADLRALAEQLRATTPKRHALWSTDVDRVKLDAADAIDALVEVAEAAQALEAMWEMSRDVLGPEWNALADRMDSLAAALAGLGITAEETACDG